MMSLSNDRVRPVPLLQALREDHDRQAEESRVQGHKGQPGQMETKSEMKEMEVVATKAAFTSRSRISNQLRNP